MVGIKLYVLSSNVAISQEDVVWLWSDLSSYDKVANKLYESPVFPMDFQIFPVYEVAVDLQCNIIAMDYNSTVKCVF